MKQKVILDTSPLVAFVDKGDNYHHWALKVWSDIATPLFTCEGVLIEACFLLRKTYGGAEAVLGLLHAGVIEIPFHLSDEVTAIEQLMKVYKSIPMSLTDACLVRMSELIPNSYLLTLDSDFIIYRKNRNEVIDVIMPS